MTTSTTPTDGGSLRPARSAPADVDRWLPDPSWPVPPRGWQLWAAAGAPTRTIRAERPGDGDESRRDVEPRIVHTVPVTSEMSAFAVLEEPSFTLPARPALRAPEPVDLLADSEPRRLPEGTVSGFAVIGALVAFSCLVGGLTAGLVVIGVSTLLAAIAAIVRGQVSLSPVGGQRGAALLLGVAVAALIVPSVTAHERRPAPEVAGGVPVPVSSPFAVATQTAYAAVPRSADAAGSATRPSVTAGASGTSSRPAAQPAATPAATRPSVAPSVAAPSATSSSALPGLTLSLDALSPKSAAEDKVQKVGHQVDDAAGQGKAVGKSNGNGKGNGKGAAASDKASDKAADKAADKASERAAAKAADKAKKAAEKAAKASAKAARAALAQAAKNTPAVSSRALLGSVGRSDTVSLTQAATAAKVTKSPATSGKPATSRR